MTFVFICGLFFAVVVHELGHAVAGKKLGVRIKTISLFGFGPLFFSWRSSFFNGARMGFGPLPYGAYVLFNDSDLKTLTTEKLDDISFAGPHMNFVMGTLIGCLFMISYGVTKPALIATILGAMLTLRPIKLFALYVILPFVAAFLLGDMFRFESMSKSVNEGFLLAIGSRKFFDFKDFVKNFLLIATLMNVVLGTLNMLPIYPLDGGHVAKRLADRTLNKEKLPYKLLFIYLPSAFVILMLLPIIGDIRKILSFLF